MPEETPELRCPTCRESALDGWRLVKCSKCGVLHHETCWSQDRRCAGTAGCKGKPQDVMVVRVPHSGPTLDEIASETTLRVRAELAPVLERIRDALPAEDEFERIHDGLKDLRSAVVNVRHHLPTFRLVQDFVIQAFVDHDLLVC